MSVAGAAFAMAALLQVGTQVAETTPPGRDTVGYWQQEADYRIAAVLDEPAGRLRARGTLRYVNRSPDTLRVLYLHQYLNAFRPGSKWSGVDEREGRVRFQRLPEGEQGFERFTAPVRVNGAPVDVEYPGVPDSTVVRLALRTPLAPRDTALVAMEWEARPSTVPRRQGRLGRSWDFAQWYPKVAVYNRLGWRPNALVPAGELYGEFGAFDVTLVVRDDQVVAGTGVVTEGDPGWGRVAQRGRVPVAVAPAYAGTRPDALLDAPERVEAPAGSRLVRFRARDVHHFAWTASPDYRYEGGAYVRPADAARMPFRTWDTVAVHVLYKPGDERDWGDGTAVEHTRRALAWLERVYGPYAYPQVTNLHRLDGGGTEFPMMMMNGSASAGLILHELGHVFTYGILANNEWRSGWMDEGLTEYQTAWAEGTTPQEAGRRAPAAPAAGAVGYRGRGLRLDADAAARVDAERLVVTGRAQPIGLPGHEFSEFAIYNDMIYDRASAMYSALRDVMGDSAFAAFLRGYYSRWGLRHVDEVAMRAEAERVHGRDLGWFFDQWVRATGQVDYGADRADTRRAGDGWETDVTVSRLGSYAHPVRIGVRTDSGWTLASLADALARRQLQTVRTSLEPREVRLDPLGTSPDWRPENDRVAFGDGRRPSMDRAAWDWPFLEQATRGGTLSQHRPTAWYTSHGGLTLGWQVRESTDGWLNRIRWGAASPLRSRAPGLAAFAGSDTRGRDAEWLPDLWFEWEDPMLGSTALPGASLGMSLLDGIVRLRVAKRFDLSPFVYAAGTRASATVSLVSWMPRGLAYVDPLRWSGRDGVELAARYDRAHTDPMRLAVSVRGAVGGIVGRGRYARAEVESRIGRDWSAFGQQSWLRLWGGWSSAGTPLEREVLAASLSPLETFGNDWLRGAGAPLARRDVPFVALGGAALRGFAPTLALGAAASATAEHDLRLLALGEGTRPLVVSLAVFADAALVLRDGGPGLPASGTMLADAGAGLVARGHWYDQPVAVRLDLPVYVSQPALAVGGRAGDDRVALRGTFSLADLW